MKAFIKDLDEKAWRSMLIGWKHPRTKDDKGNVTLTPEEKWFGNNDRLANYNFTKMFNEGNVMTFGHIQSEYANILKEKKAMNTS